MDNYGGWIHQIHDLGCDDHDHDPTRHYKHNQLLELQRNFLVKFRLEWFFRHLPVPQYPTTAIHYHTAVSERCQWAKNKDNLPTTLAIYEFI
jgi:hypothetical protein